MAFGNQTRLAMRYWISTVWRHKGRLALYAALFFAGTGIGFYRTDADMRDMPIEVARYISTTLLQRYSFSASCFEPRYAVETEARHYDAGEGKRWWEFYYRIDKPGFTDAELRIEVDWRMSTKWRPNPMLYSAADRMRYEGSCPRRRS